MAARASRGVIDGTRSPAPEYELRHSSLSPRREGNVPRRFNRPDGPRRRLTTHGCADDRPGTGDLWSRMCIGAALPVGSGGFGSGLARAYTSIHPTRATMLSDRRDNSRWLTCGQRWPRAHGRLVLVDSPAQADITVAIVERVSADSGSSFSLFPPRYYAARNIVRLRATVTRAGESADLTGGRWRESDAQGWVSAARTSPWPSMPGSVHRSSPRAGPSAIFVPWPDRTRLGSRIAEPGGRVVPLAGLRGPARVDPSGTGVQSGPILATKP